MTVRIVCPKFWDLRDVPVQVDRVNGVVFTQAGDVGFAVPLEVRFDARSEEAEGRARSLRDDLKAWGYEHVEVCRGLSRRTVKASRAAR